jgi:hypothetical protein
VTRIVLTREQFREFRRRFQDGEDVETLGPAFGIKPGTVYSYAKRMGLNTKRVYTGGLKA